MTSCYPLLMSLIHVYVYFERFFAIRKAAAESPDFMKNQGLHFCYWLPSAKNLARKRHAYGSNDGKGGKMRKPLKDIAIN